MPISKISFLLGLLAIATAAIGQTTPADTYPTGADDRAYTVATLERIVRPVLASMAEQRLKTELPVRAWEKERYLKAASR